MYVLGGINISYSCFSYHPQKYKIMKHFVKEFVLLGLISSALISSVNAQKNNDDTLLSIMREEVCSNLNKLKAREVPAYFASLKAEDLHKVTFTSDFGLSSTDDVHTRVLAPYVRVGSPQWDNYVGRGRTTFAEIFDDPGIYTIALPLKGGDPSIVRNAVRTGLEHSYAEGVLTYRSMLDRGETTGQEYDSLLSFSAVPSVFYYEADMPEEEKNIDKSQLCRYIDDASRIFREYEDLRLGRVSLISSVKRTHFVNTEGTVIAQNRRTFTLVVEAGAKAADGTMCRLEDDVFTFSQSGLPSPSELEKKVRSLAERVVAVSKAPQVDEYSGPVIISEDVAAALLNRILGRRLESKRRDSELDDFYKFKGQRILPPAFQVYADPTLKNYKGHELIGHYMYDDEGVMGQRVECIKNGVLQQYVTGRTATDGFFKSNGHGRSCAGLEPVAQMSNLIVESSEPYSDEELRAMLVAELKKQGLEYGFYIRSANCGYAVRESARENAKIDMTPVEVYRVFADGREDQLMRGAHMKGNPVELLSHIEVAGREAHVYTGRCGSPKGFIEMSAVSPALYLSKIEMKNDRKQADNIDVHVVKPDIAGNVSMMDIPLDSLIFRVMSDEMEHTLDGISSSGNDAPLLVDYLLDRTMTSEVASTSGMCLNVTDGKVENWLSVSAITGDSMKVSDTRLHAGGQFLLPDSLDSWILRHRLGVMSDSAYAQAIEQLDFRRRNAENGEEEDFVFKIRSMSPAVWFGPSAFKRVCTTDSMKRLADRLSAVFLQEPCVSGNKVTVKQVRSNYYRLNSKGQKILQPDSLFVIEAWVEVSDNGRVVSDTYMFRTGGVNDLPSEDELNAELHKFAEYLRTQCHAEATAEKYSGPVLYIGDEAVNVLRRSFLNSIHSCNYKDLGIQVYPSFINVNLIGGDSIYNGVKLFNYHQVDADGQQPKSASIIEKGVLKRKLAGWFSTAGCLESVGNSVFARIGGRLRVQPGIFVIHMQSNKGVSYKKLYKDLLKSAKTKGLNYAYIVRGSMTAPCELVRVDVSTGEEKIIYGRVGYPDTSFGALRIDEVSKDEIIYTGIGNEYDFISPNAVLLGDVELDIKGLRE